MLLVTESCCLLYNKDLRPWVQGGAWDSSSLFEENDVVSLISEQDWDM